MPERVLRNSSYLNGKSTTGTNTRVRDVSCTSGMCPLCIRDCPFLCEIALSTFRGREALYPEPVQYGFSTSGALKDFGLDWSHFNIQSSLFEVQGVEADPDVAFFENVKTDTVIGGVPLKIPIIIGAFGSTEVARLNWDGLAIGAAISGVGITIGENVCGMDPDAVITQGKVTYSKELKRRVDAFRKFWDGKHGDVAVQTNVEDQRLGVDVYALSKLEVNIIERKWGQGAKAIGGEVRINNLERAITLKKRGYLVIPDPEDPNVQAAFKEGVFRSFERHSRVGIPNAKDFVEDIENLRSHGAKHVFLKTGAYRPSAVAYTLKIASEAKIDAVTFDGAGGGTGMSPVPMMDEMSIPTVYLEAWVLKCAQILKKKGMYVPDIIMAGGFINETQIFKAIAMSNFGDGPLVKGVLMARSPLTAVMKSSYFIELANKGQLPKSFIENFGNRPEVFFAAAPELRAKYGERFKEIPWEAVGLYSYLSERVKVGLMQLMAGARKWRLDLLDRKDLMALSERAAKVTGIPLAEEAEEEAVLRILDP
ncbi:MAG: glutamate synthase-related protein [Nitrososphaerota archaeon]|nr:glutamate synthase-related protein [Candidatus Bathyarchaeota archaeon]MDW8048912.1 glutamate synthase-related protein [Nitrososphaerota archaeon]